MQMEDEIAYPWTRCPSDLSFQAEGWRRVGGAEMEKKGRAKTKLVLTTVHVSIVSQRMFTWLLSCRALSCRLLHPLSYEVRRHVVVSCDTGTNAQRHLRMHTLALPHPWPSPHPPSLSLIVLIDERDLKVDIWDSKWRYEGLATLEWNANDTWVREVLVLQTIPTWG